MMLLAVIAMMCALLLTPLGAPGNWIMIGILVIATFTGHVGIPVLILCIAFAAIAEMLEFVLMRRMSEKYGGTRRAFWGALFGGIAGVFIGTPIPVAGSVVAGLIGTFVGAALATYSEARSLGGAGRVGWGAMLGRMWAAVIKTAAGIAILVAGAAALLA